ncbi:MAG: S-layer homology domain-containing protein [Clostridia bacterium]|nr:S-layer homology domain-containing protein [Clostridia bacterium]
MKKIICILLAVTMLAIYMPVMAASPVFSDVPNNSSYKNAIYTLADFGIILGDAGADTFRPKANISREEFSVIMTRVLGLGALNGTVTEYPFPDVTPATAADWSIKATKIAYDLGIIKGFEDGTFRPKESVTFEQAVKMIVCALGYDASAQEQGGWPNGYIAVARGFGILNNAEAPQTLPASREIIAQLVANSLEVTLAGTEVEENRTILTEKLRYTEGTGVVTGVEGKALKSNASGIKEDEIQIDNSIKFKVGDTSAKEYFGKQIKYYYKDDDGNKVLVSARLTTKNSEVTIPSAQVKDLYPTKVEFYPDVDDTNTYDTYEFEANNVSAIYNGKYVAAITEEMKPDSGSIRLIDNNGNGTYDVVIIDAAQVYVVSSIDSAKKIIYNEYNQAQSLNLNTATGKLDVTITKANTEVDFSHIKKGDVLLVSGSLSPVGKQVYNVEIVTNSVTGTVTAINPSYGEVIISGKAYEYSTAYERYLTTKPTEAMEIGDKVTAYLDNNNKILAAAITSIATTTKYGYLIDADGLEKNEYAQFKIYTTDNKTVVLKGATRVKINGISYTYDKVPEALEETNRATNKDSAAENDLRAQLIKYTTNSSGQIDNIYTIQTTGDSDKTLVLSKAYQEDVNYTSTGRQLGTGITLSTTTKVLFVPGDRYDTDEYSAGTYSKLKNGSKYDFEAYDCSETNVPAIVVIYGSPSSIGLDDTLVTFALVDSIKDTIKDGEALTTLKCKVDGADKTYYCEDSSVLDSYSKGDVLKIEFDAKGYIKAVAPAFEWHNLPAEGASARYVTKADSTNSYKSIYGTVYARDEERITITPYDVKEDASLVGTPIYNVPISSSTKIFVLDTTVSESSANRLTTGTIDSIAGYLSSATGASKVYTYIRNNSTKFILVVIK